jgi:hypothetical protein
LARMITEFAESVIEKSALRAQTRGADVTAKEIDKPAPQAVHPWCYITSMDSRRRIVEGFDPLAKFVLAILVVALGAAIAAQRGRETTFIVMAADALARHDFCFRMWKHCTRSGDA